LSKFAVTEKETIIFFNPYEVAPYVAGIQEVKLINIG
jgi:hypothetical protein